MMGDPYCRIHSQISSGTSRRLFSKGEKVAAHLFLSEMMLSFTPHHAHRTYPNLVHHLGICLRFFLT